MSRQPTWDSACALQADMFREAASIGGLDIQLVYFRGLNECRSSGWVAGTEKLAGLMSAIDCRGGHTQIGKVLSHARQEHAKQRVQALVFVGDAMEESVDNLCAAAGELGLLGVPVFMFQEGYDGVAEQRVSARSPGCRTAPIAVSIPVRRTNLANFYARWRLMSPAASRRWPICRRANQAVRDCCWRSLNKCRHLSSASWCWIAAASGCSAVISKIDPKVGARILKASGGIRSARLRGVSLGLRGEFGLAHSARRRQTGPARLDAVRTGRLFRPHPQKRRQDFARQHGVFRNGA